jgi:hypothetical protein
MSTKTDYRLNVVVRRAHALETLLFHAISLVHCIQLVRFLFTLF